MGALANVKIRSSLVGWGELRSDGSLGYDGGCCPQPRCRSELQDCRVISAHAPARLEIETDEPLEIFGFLNASAAFQPHNPVEFWANWNFVGELTLPAAVTAPLTLRPG